MLSFGNKDFRNLQEQVLKNMSDIQDMMQGVNVLADFGIKVVGQVDSAADLPDPSEYEGDYGDAYVVGESEPYDYYIFTRAFEGEEEPQWFNLGQFPVPGPQGETGPQGEIGETPNVAMEIGTVSTLISTQSATASIVKSGTLENPVFTLNLAIPKGPMGMMGLTGPQGPRGPQGPQGEQGPKGEQGGLIEIVGIVATASQLPSPATLQKLDAAYLVGASPDYELYVQVGESPSTALWTNLGAINEGTVVTVNGEPQTVWEASGQFVPIYDGQLVDTLYGQAAGTGNGQTHVPYGTSATANYIVQRDINAQIEVPQTPTNNGHAASKKYVDDTVSAVLPTAYAGDLIVGTSTAHQATRLAIGSANQVLGVNSAGTGLEYKTINSVPSYTSSDNDKVLKVNSLGTDLEWGVVSGGGGGFGNNIDDFPFVSYKPTTLRDSGFLKIGTSVANDAIGYNHKIGTVAGDLFIINDSSNSSGGQTWSNVSGSIIVGAIPSSSSTGNPFSTSSILNSITLMPQNSSGTNRYITNLNSSILTIPTLGTSLGAIDGMVVNSAGVYQSASGNNKTELQACLCLGAPATGGTNTSYNVLCRKAFIGSGLYMHTANHLDNTFARDLGVLVLGMYNKDDVTDTNTNALVVGCGTSASTRANSFAAGKDSNGDCYIYVGNTKVTESQLQALLALLN